MANEALPHHEQGIQNRVLSIWPAWELKKPADLLMKLKGILFAASNEEKLASSQNDIQKWVKLDPEKQDNGQLPAARDYVIVGGEKDFRREPGKARLKRDDGAWIHFTITVRWDGAATLELMAQDFEIVFPEGHHPPFVRVDLNLPGHENEHRELRSHLHPGNDDLQLPAPVMSPPEILQFFIDRLRPRNVDKPRS
jgi:hypothetical protein